MKNSIVDEYCMLTDKKQDMEREMLSLPTGYISRKMIGGNTRYYLQRREGDKIRSSYIRNCDVEDVGRKIERRKEIAGEVSVINERLAQLEKAAKLIDKNLFCNLMIYKLGSGMDALNTQEREKCASFGHAMNAIEGVPVTSETNAEINAWKSGKQSFLTVFENTLRRYGFPVEARL